MARTAHMVQTALHLILKPFSPPHPFLHPPPQVLAGKLPEAEVNAALEDVLLEAAAEEDEGLDWAAFQALLSLPPVGGGDSVHGLDQYDARLRPGEEGGGKGSG
jgi:hypothetical protein